MPSRLSRTSKVMIWCNFGSDQRAMIVAVLPGIVSGVRSWCRCAPGLRDARHAARVLTHALKYLLTMDMRRILSALLVAAATGLWLAPAAAEYPARPVSLIVAFTPGGPSDVLARILGKKIGELLGQPS